MEEPIKEQPVEFAFSGLKIRTMQDDLKKHAGQADLPTVPAPPPKPQTPSPAPKETIAKEIEQADAPKISQFQKISSIAPPEPPPFLPSKPVSPPTQAVQQIPKPVSFPMAPLPKQAAPIEPLPPSIPKPQSDLIYKETPKPEPIRQPRRIKIGLAFGVPAAVVILGIFGFIYYRFWVAPPPLCAEGRITEDCRCGEQSGKTESAGFCCDNLWADFDCALTKAPQPLIPSINELLTINAEGSTLDEIISDIKNAEANISGEDARIIALKLADSPSRYATLDDVIKIFGIVLPENIKTNNQAFNLLLYVKPAENYSSAPETRLALVLSQKNKSSLEQAMSDWETTMLADMKPMILGEPAEPATPEFINTVYHNGLFRYKNLPIKTTTINYTVYQNLIILGTSKNSIFYVYDSLVTNNPGAANP